MKKSNFNGTVNLMALSTKVSYKQYQCQQKHSVIASNTAYIRSIKNIIELFQLKVIDHQMKHRHTYSHHYPSVSGMQLLLRYQYCIIASVNSGGMRHNTNSFTINFQIEFDIVSESQLVKMSKRKRETPIIEKKHHKRRKLIINTQTVGNAVEYNVIGKLIPSALKAQSFLASGVVVAPYDVDLVLTNSARGLHRKHRMQIVDVSREYYFVSERVRSRYIDVYHNLNIKGSIQTQIKGPFAALEKPRKLLERKFRIDTGKFWIERVMHVDNGRAKYCVTRMHPSIMNVDDASDCYVEDDNDDSDDYDSDQSYVDSDDSSDFRRKNDLSCVFWDDRTRTVGSHSLLNTLTSVKSLKDFSNSMLNQIVQFASEQCYGFGCNLEMHDFLIHGKSLRTTICSVPLIKEFPETLVNLLIGFVYGQCDDCQHITDDFKLKQSGRDEEWTQIGTNFVCSKCVLGGEIAMEGALCGDCNREDVDTFYDDQAWCHQCEDTHVCKECFQAHWKKCVALGLDHNGTSGQGRCCECMGIEDDHITKFASRSNQITEIGDNVLSSENCGILYYQTAFYTKDQMDNALQFSEANPEKKSVALFGDNFRDKSRSNTVSGQGRNDWGGSCTQIMGHYDRNVAYGITTTMDLINSETNECEKVEMPLWHQYKTQMKQEFAPLRKILKKGGHVIVPARRVVKAAYEGVDSEPVCLKHNLGTGYANLPVSHQEMIQREIDYLERIASETVQTSWMKYCSCK